MYLLSKHFLDCYHEQGRHFEVFENNYNFLGVLEGWEKDKMDRGSIKENFVCYVRVFFGRGSTEMSQDQLNSHIKVWVVGQGGR